MKNLIKIFFITLVILGLVASYMNFGAITSNIASQADVAENFRGPDTLPSTNGPTDLPPGQSGQ